MDEGLCSAEALVSQSQRCVTTKEIGAQNDFSTNTVMHNRKTKARQLSNAGENKHFSDTLILRHLNRDFERFYNFRARRNYIQMLKNKKTAFAAAIKVITCAQAINDRFSTAEIHELSNPEPENIYMIELETNVFRFAVPVRMEDLPNFYLERSDEDGYVRAKIAGENTKHSINCSNENGYLSAAILRSQLHICVLKAVEQVRGLDIVSGHQCKNSHEVSSIKLYENGSTSILEIEAQGAKLFVELLPAICLTKKNQDNCKVFARGEYPSYIVAKPCHFPLSDPEVLWEVSFITAERKRLSELNDTQTQLLDTIIEIRRRDELLKELSIQQLRTILFLAVDNNDSSKWSDADNLGECFLKTMIFMESVLWRKFCPNYYLPEANSFAFMNPITLSKIKDRVRHFIKPSCGACGIGVILNSKE